DSALAVDRADSVAVPIKCQSEIELLVGDERLEVCEVLLLGRIRMVIGKMSVDFRVQKEMLPRQPGREQFERGPRRAVARVPADPKSGQALVADPSQRFDEAIDIGVEDLATLAAALAIEPCSLRRHSPQLLDVLPKKRPPLK